MSPENRDEEESDGLVPAVLCLFLFITPVVETPVVAVVNRMDGVPGCQDKS